MQPSKERIYYLLKSYADGFADEAEKEELYQWAAHTSDDSEIKSFVKQLIETRKSEQFPEIDWKKMYWQIWTKTQVAQKTHLVRRRKWFRIAVAILILVLGAGTIYQFVSHSGSQVDAPVIVADVSSLYKNDIKSGGTKAVLHAGNSSVMLTSVDTTFTLAGNKVEITNGDVKISEVKPVEYTLTVPRGGTYSLVLADGTKVWLNAESKLVYPSVFTKDTREVRLIGEAYFDVATDAQHPFVVHTDSKQIAVLGTQFNVHAYKGEPYTATLVKGKVAVKEGKTTLVLQPGEQAVIDENGRLSLNEHPDIEQIVAWKNGYFRFDKADIHTVMNSLSRWYDIDVEYATDLPQLYFGAIMNRDNNISKILKMLEATGEVHFEIEGKTVRVSE